jgi:hypothetical protein
MPVGYETIDYSNLELSIKRSQDVHSAFQYEYLLADGIDAHFISRVFKIGVGTFFDLTSKYWKVTDYITNDGYFILPKDYVTVSAYSRRAFMYPNVYAWTALPDIRNVGNESSTNFYIGIENGASATNGIASFMLLTSGALRNVLYVVVGSLHGSVHLSINVAKPPDFSTARHSYRIIHSRSATFFMIDNRIRAIALQCNEGTAVKVNENVLPYSIALIPQMPGALTALVEWHTVGRTAPATEDLYAPLSPAWFRVSDGKDIIPLQLSLYLANSDTKLAGYSISSGSVTSHPFPLWGYTNRTLLFMSNQAGTLDIQVYTLSGNWRSYDTVSVSADTLVKYRFQDAFPLARVVFTPSTYPATINEAEIDLS